MTYRVLVTDEIDAEGVALLSAEPQLVVDEVSLDSPFREKARSFTGLCAFSDAKDLHFQDCLRVFPGMRSRTPLILHFLN